MVHPFATLSFGVLICVAYYALRIISSDSEDGLNEVEDDEDPEELGDLDSGTESAEDDIVDEDKSDTKEESMDDDATDGAADEDSQSDPNSPAAIAERHFTKKFLTSLGGVDKVLASAKDMDKLREHTEPRQNFEPSEAV
ncbi:hypothetical protein GQ600_22515 [Phytophthora cactorum]|nr:hypothetical protein GQ600_22515 [Phytophthora cactorum]